VSDIIIGIDLGTTNSCAAYVDGYKDGVPNVKLIPYKGGDYTVPSIYAVDEKGNELIGYEAKRQWQLNPRNTVYGAKRLVGRTPTSDIVETMKKVVQYGVKASADNKEVTIEVAKKDLTLQEVSARILNKIRDVASNYLRQPIHKAVVTVPAYFSDRQRQSVKDAGKLINLEVVRIINEPTAAALAYGLNRRLNEKVVIYDLGGGTFDVSIIEIREQVFEVKATGGDIFLGGIDFDNAMIHFVLREFQTKTGIDLSSDPVAMQRIKDLAERTKMDLSTRDEAPFNIPFITMTPQGQPLNIEMKFSRKLLEKLTSDLVDRTLKIVARVLVDSGLSTSQIDEVMLVGGQTRMPIVQERLTKFFSKTPSKAVHPDEAVAIGAALYGFSLQDDTNLKLQLLDVIPMAIGLEKADGNMHIVFNRNSPIPNAKKIVGTTSIDNQGELIMRIWQGDHAESTRNEQLGEFTFSGIRAAPSGHVKVDVTFDVSIEGILNMTARDPDTGKELKTTVRVTQT
jgi:molecular chaperone DnaK